jgi:hypothetical protein
MGYQVLLCIVGSVLSLSMSGVAVRPVHFGSRRQARCLKYVAMVSNYLTEVRRASEFTTVVGANSVMELFNACAFKVKLWDDVGGVIRISFVDA